MKNSTRDTRFPIKVHSYEVFYEAQYTANLA